MKLGFIGCGNMANAIMGGVISSGLMTPDEIIGSDPLESGRNRASGEHGIHVTASNLEVVEKADTLLFAIKPQYYDGMLAEIRDAVRPDQLIISIAAVGFGYYIYYSSVRRDYRNRAWNMASTAASFIDQEEALEEAEQVIRIYDAMSEEEKVQ